jgi:hypothetical protein
MFRSHYSFDLLYDFAISFVEFYYPEVVKIAEKIKIIVHLNDDDTRRFCISALYSSHLTLFSLRLVSNANRVRNNLLVSSSRRPFYTFPLHILDLIQLQQDLVIKYSIELSFISNDLHLPDGSILF